MTAAQTRSSWDAGIPWLDRPMPEGKNIVRYETPEVFEMLTKEWGITKPKKRRRRASEKKTAEASTDSAELVS